MAGTEEASSSSYRDVADRVAGLTGTAISITGDIVDIETDERLGGKILGPTGMVVDGYFKSSDEDGLTIHEVVSIGGSFFGGFYTSTIAAVVAPSTLGLCSPIFAQERHEPSMGMTPGIGWLRSSASPHFWIHLTDLLPLRAQPRQLRHKMQPSFGLAAQLFPF